MIKTKAELQEELQNKAPPPIKWSDGHVCTLIKEK